MREIADRFFMISYICYYTYCLSCRVNNEYKKVTELLDLYAHSNLRTFMHLMALAIHAMSLI